MCAFNKQKNAKTNLTQETAGIEISKTIVIKFIGSITLRWAVQKKTERFPKHNGGLSVCIKVCMDGKLQLFTDSLWNKLKLIRPYGLRFLIPAGHL